LKCRNYAAARPTGVSPSSRRFVLLVSIATLVAFISMLQTCCAAVVAGPSGSANTNKTEETMEVSNSSIESKGRRVLSPYAIADRYLYRTFIPNMFDLGGEVGVGLPNGVDQLGGPTSAWSAMRIEAPVVISFCYEGVYYLMALHENWMTKA